MALLTIVHPKAAGIDIGKEKLFVAVHQQPVQIFDTFTVSLNALVAYLQQHGITTVAMEATGVFWLPIYDVLEQAKIDIFLVNAKHVKMVPGRKSDVQDCQWLQQLHAFGLLRKSFIPDAMIRELRTYMRLRKTHVEDASRAAQRMHKALDEMNLKIGVVLSQIIGKSGLTMIRAIVNGERNPSVLLALCDKRIRQAKSDQMLLALAGHYKVEYVFALEQALNAYDFYQAQIASCDAEIAKCLAALTKDLPPPSQDSPAKPARHNPPQIADLHTLVVQLSGEINLSAVPGLSDATVLNLLSELGTDLSSFPSESHFVSWCGLSPVHAQSGNRRWKSVLKKGNRVGQIFRLSVQSIANSSSSALSRFYCRIKFRSGAKIANKAAARKLAGQFYRLLRFGQSYTEEGAEKYEQRFKEQQERRLQKHAQKLGFKLVPTVPM